MFAILDDRYIDTDSGGPISDLVEIANGNHLSANMARQKLGEVERGGSFEELSDPTLTADERMALCDRLVANRTRPTRCDCVAEDQRCLPTAR